MKLSDYAKQAGVSYKTAWRWFKAGTLPGRQMDTGTIIVSNPPSGVTERIIAELTEQPKE